MKTLKQLIVIGIFGVVIAVGFTATGLYNPARKKLIGKWDVSFEMTQTDLRQMGFTNNPLVAATAQTLVKTMQAKMEVEFRADDTATLGVTTFGFVAGDSATWKVAATDGDQVTIEIKFSDDDAPKQWIGRFLDDNTFQMASPKDSRFPVGQMVVFRRAVAEPAS
ncbi:MAG: hypothetical protein H6821_00245 [Planctomycetaceae bacterium]|nr:hypothetical protein [Planctomycetales bacterium]MCB9872580.1 hypothetical protein [Planctomycetaceae bacterium]MCB9939594.1 hypothetical protein [Planctomycetaceae bacterium]HRX78216.1 hypothetical protein [Pirellulaceae bacterium]